MAQVNAFTKNLSADIFFSFSLPFRGKSIMNYFLRILHFGIKSRRVYLKWVRRVHAIMTHKRTLIGYWAQSWLITHDYSSWTGQRNLSRLCISLLFYGRWRPPRTHPIFYDKPENPQLEVDIGNRVQYYFKCAIQRGYLLQGSIAVVVTLTCSYTRLYLKLECRGCNCFNGYHTFNIRYTTVNSDIYKWWSITDGVYFN